MATGIYTRTHTAWNKGLKGVQVAWNKGMKKYTEEESKAKKLEYNLKNKEMLQAAKDKWREENRDKVNASNRKSYRTKGKDLRLKKQYGISLDEYNLRLEAQNYACAICLSTEVGRKGTFNVDHCHTTGKVRGLLCHQCNVGLGMFKDNVESLQTAIKYLTQ